MATPDVLMAANTDHRNNNDDETELAVFESLDTFAACFGCNPFDNFLPDLVALKGQAFDSIVVLSKATGRAARSDFFLNFDHPTFPFPPHSVASTSNSSSSTTTNSTPSLAGDSLPMRCEALLEVVDDTLGKVYFTIEHDAVHKKNRLQQPPSCECMHRTSSTSFSPTNNNHNGRTTAAAPRQSFSNEREQDNLLLLAKMLKPGKNPVRYLFRNEKRVLGVAEASIFLWSDQDRVVVCDVDGTITKTNVRGIFDTIVTEKYAHCHDRVCRFLSMLERKGLPDKLPSQEESPPQVNFLYLSSRPLIFADTTRKFLSNLRQPLEDDERQRTGQEQQQPTADDCIEGEHHRLPPGPLIGFGGKFMEVMKMELFSFNVHLFKAKVLMDQVVTPFCCVAPDPHEKHKSLFVAGFGNTFMDVQAYHMAGMTTSQIYMIDKKSRIACLDAGSDDDASAAAASKSLLDEADDNESNHPKRSSWRRLSSFSSQQQRRSSASTSTASSDGSAGKFRLVDDALPAEVNDARPSLKNPMPRKSYRKLLGTAFSGYHDDSLHSHVFS